MDRARDGRGSRLTRRGLLFGGGSVLALVWAERVDAQLAVICPDCSQLWQQLVGYALEIKAFAQQILSYVNDVTQTVTMFTNLVNIPFQIYNTIKADISAVIRLANLGSLLAGRSGGIISRLNAVSAAGNQIKGTAYQLGNLPNQMENWGRTLGNSAQKLGELLDQQHTTIKKQADTAETAAGHVQAAGGNLEAIQASAEIARNTGDVMMQMHETLIAFAQDNATRNAQNADRQAAADAAVLDFTNQPLGDPPMHGNNGYGPFGK